MWEESLKLGEKEIALDCACRAVPAMPKIKRRCEHRRVDSITLILKSIARVASDGRLKISRELENIHETQPSSVGTALAKTTIGLWRKSSEDCVPYVGVRLIEPD